MSTLVKSNDFPALRSALENFWNPEKFFNRPFLNGQVLPAVNVKDKKNSYELEVAAPGFKKEDFKLITENGLLTISAETSSEKEEEDENFTRQEFSRSSFSRTFNLPDNVSSDDISAKFQDGLLKVDIKKSGKSISPKKEVKIK